jgi:hypothetical protein
VQSLFGGGGKIPKPKTAAFPTHPASPRPEDGYPYKVSYVADNVLALGKLVALLSHSPFWKDMAIMVTEDDAQGGTDHVDAHRSLLMVISPYARRGVSHVHTSMASG